MKHRHETEIKLAVKDAKEIRWRLTELGFRPVLARHFESNYLYDFPDQRLRKARCLIRLRFAGDQGLLTYKGAPLRSRDYKIRREIETHVEDGHRLGEILLLLGLQRGFQLREVPHHLCAAGQARRGRRAARGVRRNAHRQLPGTGRPAALDRRGGAPTWLLAPGLHYGKLRRALPEESARPRVRPRGI